MISTGLSTGTYVFAGIFVVLQMILLYAIIRPTTWRPDALRNHRPKPDFSDSERRLDVLESQGKQLKLEFADLSDKVITFSRRWNMRLRREQEEELPLEQPEEDRLMQIRERGRRIRG